MNTCASCIHWVQEKETITDPDPIKRYGKCGAVVSFVDAKEDDYENALAFASDYEHYWAELITHPNFGCILHKEKSTNG